MLSGLSISYLSLIFARKREPSLEAAEKIAAALRMGLEEFLYGLRGYVVHIHTGYRGGRQTKLREAFINKALNPKKK